MTTLDISNVKSKTAEFWHKLPIKKKKFDDNKFKILPSIGSINSVAVYKGVGEVEIPDEVIKKYSHIFPLRRTLSYIDACEAILIDTIKYSEFEELN